MKFLDRIEELSRLDRLAGSRAGGLAVLYGRRRIGKTRLLLAEARWSTRPFGGRALQHLVRALTSRPAPSLPARYAGLEVTRALFLPEVAAGSARRGAGFVIVTAQHILSR